MINDLKAFQEKLKADKTLQKKMEDILKTSTEENAVDNFIAVAAEEGYTITKDDVKNYAEEYKSELSDEELENVSGGTLVVVTVMGVVSVVSAAGVLTYTYIKDPDAFRRDNEDEQGRKNG